ncbi:MAG: YkvA family protein [Bacteroidales bacterium]|nr:YkvA family protein [Bacteroidales bacterium]
MSITQNGYNDFSTGHTIKQKRYSMHLGRFLEICKKASLTATISGGVRFKDDDNNYLPIRQITIKDNKIVFKIGGKAAYRRIDKLIEMLERKDADMSMSAINEANSKEYDFLPRWAIDPNGRFYIRIKEIVHNEQPLGDTKKYIKEFKEEDKNESVFSGKIRDKARSMGINIVYHAYWLYYALGSGLLNAQAIAIVTGALGYLLCPIDIISDLIPIIGFSDDAIVLLTAYQLISKSVAQRPMKEITAKAKNAVKKIFGNFSDDDIKI